MMSASGYASPISIAHIPVPVAISNTFWGGFSAENGAKCRCPSMNSFISSYWSSRRSLSVASLGKWYAGSLLRRCLTAIAVRGQPTSGTVGVICPPKLLLESGYAVRERECVASRGQLVGVSTTFGGGRTRRQDRNCLTEECQYDMTGAKQRARLTSGSIFVSLRYASNVNWKPSKDGTWWELILAGSGQSPNQECARDANPGGLEPR